MDTIKYVVPRGTVNRIKTANAIGIQELELKPVTLIAAPEGQFEVIHKNSIPGIEMDLESAPLGWIYWKPGNEQHPGYTPKSTSDSTAAFNFFNKMYSYNTKG